MDSKRFGLSSLLNLALHRDKCKICKSYLEYATVKDNTLTFECTDCHESCQNELDKDFKTLKVL